MLVRTIHQSMWLVTLGGLNRRGCFHDVSGRCCASCQVSAVLPKGQVLFKLQQAFLIVEAHVVGGAGLACQVQVQRPADLLLHRLTASGLCMSEQVLKLPVAMYCAVTGCLH